jgi:hypothetical protein
MSGARAPFRLDRIRGGEGRFREVAGNVMPRARIAQICLDKEGRIRRVLVKKVKLN